MNIAAFQLNKEFNDLTDEDFAKITKFELKFKQLSYIKLLEKFTNLHVLDLGYIRYPDKNIPKWMKYLAKYGIFNLDEKFAIDLSPLKNLSALKKLQLTYVQIFDITSLKELVNLEMLSIIGISLSDFKPIKELTNLKVLRLDGTNISDLKPLVKLANLQTLYLVETPIYSLEQIKNLANLEVLVIGSCRNITDEQIKDLQKALARLAIVR